MAKRKDNGGSKYRSRFEADMAAIFGESAEYETESFEYEKPAETHRYVPDFIVEDSDGHRIYLEMKGRFRTMDEARKYVWVKRSNPDLDLRFVVMDRKTKMPRSKKTTMYDWLVKNGFIVYTRDTMPNFRKTASKKR